MDTLKEILRISVPPKKAFAASASLGVGAAVCTVALMACSGILIDKAALRPPLYTLMVLMAGVQLLALGRGPLRYAERLVSHDAALRILGRLRIWLYDEIEPRSPAGLIPLGNGDVLARASSDIDSLQDLFLKGITPFVIAVSTSIFAVILLGVLLPSAGLVLGVCLFGAILLTTAVAWARQSGKGSQEVDLRARLTAEMVSLLQGAPDLIAFGRDKEFLERTLQLDSALTRLGRMRSWTAGAVTGLSNLMTGAAVVGSLVVAIPAVTSGRLPGYMLAVLPLVAFATFEVVTPVADAVSKLSHHVAAGRRLVEIAALPVSLVDPLEPVQPPEQTGISIDDAYLRYTDDGPYALAGLSMKFPEAKHVAVVGSSGAGKSSMVNVLLRFWRLSSGSASIGGQSIEDLSQQASRNLIGWVGQDAHLFNTTIGANISLARPEATSAEVAAAAEAAQLGQWIATLPDGFDTQIGEQGAQLSGGQRQRLALARALLADQPVLVLDEPTSGLDEPTAVRLLADVRSATAGKSLIYITHRTEELPGFDEINVIEDGRLFSG
jgi:thiol reductant ABC exporter CydC subunit